MNLDRIRLRLTLAYVGIFTLILFLLGAVAVVSFYEELTIEQDDLLTQEARNQTANLLNGENRKVLADGSDEFGWVALDPEGRAVDEASAAPLSASPNPRWPARPSRRRALFPGRSRARTVASGP